MVRDFFPEKAQHGEYPLQSVCPGYESALLGDTERRQSEARGRNAADDPLVLDLDIAAVFHHAGEGTGLLPKKLKIDSLHFVEKLIVFGSQRIGRQCRRGRQADILLLRIGEQGQGGGKRQAGAGREKLAQEFAARGPAGSRIFQFRFDCSILNELGREKDGKKSTHSVSSRCWNGDTMMAAGGICCGIGSVGPDLYAARLTPAVR
jgi:hypothetical protein